MSIKEKLQEIKERVNKLVNYKEASDSAMYYMKKRYINWLIEQAEKVEKLQDQKDFWLRNYETLEQQFQQANEKIERHEKALKEISNREEPLFDGEAMSFYYTAVETAKQALEGSE